MMGLRGVCMQSELTGTYKDAVGSATCTSCPSGKYSPTIAADHSWRCSSCATGTYDVPSKCLSWGFSRIVCARIRVVLPSESPTFSYLSAIYSPAAGDEPIPSYNAIGGPRGRGHVEFDSYQVDACTRTALSINACKYLLSKKNLIFLYF